MKLNLTNTSVQVGGALHTFALNLDLTNSEVVKASDGTNVFYDDTNASVSNKIPMDQATLLLILANSGEMTEHIMYIQATDTIAGTPVSVGLPRREFLLGSIKDFLQWYGQNSEVWTEDPGTGVLFSTNVFAENAPDEYLKGSEMEIIRQLDTINYFILNETEKDALIVSGWTKYVWNP